jgi:hypothetical protein
MLPSKCNIIAMTATYRQSDQDVMSVLFGRIPDKAIWLDLSCQGIHFDVILSGCPSSSITNSVTQDYKFQMDMKTIVYSNSKKQAMVSIAAAMETVLERSPNTGKMIPMTGDDGLQFKVFTMHAFANDYNDSQTGIGFDLGTTSVLPTLVIMPATKAADCGVSSKLCWKPYHNGQAPLMYSLVQEIGRVNRNPLEGPGDYRYEVHVSFLCPVKLYVRILQAPDPHEQAIQLESMNEVLKLLVTPNECQHVMMEKFFENPVSTRLYKSCQSLHCGVDVCGCILTVCFVACCLHRGVVVCNVVIV